MQRLTALAIALACVLASTAADARPKHARIAAQESAQCLMDNNGRQVCRDGVSRIQSHQTGRVAYGDVAVIGGRPAGCPWRYCGCAVSLKVFGRIIPELNLAANWLRKFPRARPAAGMVAARHGHVFYIQSVNGDGTVVAYDPNSGGHKTRIHTVSLRGFRVVDPNGAKVASR